VGIYLYPRTRELAQVATALNVEKGVVVGVLPDNMMPVDANGVRAECMLDPTSIPGFDV